MSIAMTEHAPVKVNGFPVIADKRVSAQEYLVVCDRGAQGPHDRYVTWRVYWTGDGSVSAFAGFYTSDIRKAIHDMDTR